MEEGKKNDDPIVKVLAARPARHAQAWANDVPEATPEAIGRTKELHARLADVLEGRSPSTSLASDDERRVVAASASTIRVASALYAVKGAGRRFLEGYRVVLCSRLTGACREIDPALLPGPEATGTCDKETKNLIRGMVDERYGDGRPWSWLIMPGMEPFLKEVCLVAYKREVWRELEEAGDPSLAKPGAIPGKVISRLARLGYCPRYELACPIMPLQLKLWVLGEPMCGAPGCCLINNEGTKKKLRLCDRCRMVSYCDEECQKRDHERHRLICKDKAAATGVCMLPVRVRRSIYEAASRELERA